MGCWAAIILFGIGIFVWPLLYFLGGYMTGLALSWVVGDLVVDTLNLMLNTTRFSVETLPMVCAVLGVIGSFFKGSVSITRKD